MPHATKSPTKLNHCFTAYLCGHRMAGQLRLPKEASLEDRLWVGMRWVFKDFLASKAGQGYTIEDVLEDHCFAWTRIS